MIKPLESRGVVRMDTFLFDIPHFFYMGYVPPLKIVNIFLEGGLRDAGMGGGCEWEPFEIGISEYE